MLGKYFATGGALAYTNKVIALAPIAYWPLADAAGASVVTDESGNGRNGTYTAVTLGQTGIGDGRTAASFDGSTSFANVFSTSLQSAFNGAEGTIATWLRVSSSSVWTDATLRSPMTLSVTGSNVVRIRKPTTSNQIQGTYIANAINLSVTVGTSSLAWLHLAVTWSKSADQVIVYLNGTQSGSTLTGLGVFSGSLLSTTTTLGASSTTPAAPWSGLVAHAAVWTTPLSAAQVATLAVVP